jgi:hypothetical protein
MSDNIFFLGIALIAAWYWIRDPQADYYKRLKRSLIMGVVIAFIIGTF